MISDNRVAMVAATIFNYGSMLQTYALQRVLEKNGYSVDVLKYKSTITTQWRRIRNITYVLMQIKIIKKKIISRLFRRKTFNDLEKRYNKFKEFQSSNCNFTELITKRKDLINSINNYNICVLGSDQVWNPANLEMDYFTLGFVPDHILKVAYAPSFGVSIIPNYQVKKTKLYLDRIEYISVREITGQSIIQNLTNKVVPIVCDPTALIERNEWDCIMSDTECPSEKYILCYYLGNNPEHREYAKKVKRATGYAIVALTHLDYFVSSDDRYADYTPFDVGPREFIGLIANAQLVLTDSFHGTMFSIYYHKNFWTFSRYTKGGRESTNSRIDSILKILGLQQHHIDTSFSVKLLFETEDWEKVEENLTKFRSESSSFLESAMKDLDNRRMK